jgi:hypothetical protein
MTIVVKDADGAHQLDASGVQDEGHLQRFIFENPDSLPLADVKQDARLMIVGREFPTSSGPIDVLAIDGDGDIYVVETKLYKNPDKRRVIAQLLDYGAALWRGYADPGSFIAALEASVNRQAGGTLHENVAEFYELDEEEAAEAIRCIAENLGHGNFKFVVLMDQLDSRLRDLILFLNQRSRFDVYAVVMQFYRHADIEIVIPKLFGAEVAKDTPRQPPKTKGWNATTFFEAAKQSVNPNQLDVIQRVYRFATQHADQVRWARGVRGAFRPQFKRPYEEIHIKGKVGPLFTVHTDGELSLNFGALSRHEQLKRYRDRFAARLRELDFPSIPDDVESDAVTIPIDQWERHVSQLLQAVQEIFASPK